VIIKYIWPNDTQKLNLTEEEEEIHEEVKHSLGNLTLTIGPRNSGWKNLPYLKKRNRIDEDQENDSDYMNSDFTITREVARRNEQWGGGADRRSTGRHRGLCHAQMESRNRRKRGTVRDSARDT